MATAAATAVPCSFSASGVIRGYHVYQRIWTPHVGEEATTVRESGNQHDRFTVVVLEDETLCTVSSESLVFVGRPDLSVRFIGGSALGFPRCRKRSILRELVVA